MSKTLSRLIPTGLSLLIFVGCTAPVAPSVPPQTTAITPVQLSQLASLQQKLEDDESLLPQLEQDPKAVLKSYGIHLPQSEQIKILNMDEQLFLILDDRNLTTFHTDLINQNQADKSDLQQQLDAVRVKAKENPEFKMLLLKDTEATLLGEGFDTVAASMFKVVDYQPNTSLLLLSPTGAELPRDIGSLPKVFTGITQILKDILNKAIDSIKKLGPKSVAFAASAAAFALSKASQVACSVTTDKNSFACTKGVETKYWLDGINEYLISIGLMQDSTVSAITKQIEVTKQNLALLNDQLLKTQKERTEAEKNNASPEIFKRIDLRIKEIGLLITETQKQISQMEYNLKNAKIYKK